jgi:hypothetical protein
VPNKPTATSNRSYLLAQAKQANPSPFMTLLGKLVPTGEHHNHDGEINVSITYGDRGANRRHAPQGDHGCRGAARRRRPRADPACVEKAKEGDMTVLRLCLERIIPQGRTVLSALICLASRRGPISSRLR